MELTPDPERVSSVDGIARTEESRKTDELRHPVCSLRSFIE